MQARDAQLPLPACAVLLSPATDISMSGPSIRYNAKADPMFSAGAGDLLPDLYCPGLERTLPLISPLHGDWTGLPPLYFLAGSTEMLLDDSVRAHDRAQQAGTSSRIDVWPDMPHVFPLPAAAGASKRSVTSSRSSKRACAKRGPHALPQSAEPHARLDPGPASGLSGADPANRGSL
jgi:acetyl esterase/lipase